MILFTLWWQRNDKNFFPFFSTFFFINKKIFPKKFSKIQLIFHPRMNKGRDPRPPFPLEIPFERDCASNLVSRPVSLQERTVVMLGHREWEHSGFILSSQHLLKQSGSNFWWSICAKHPERGSWNALLPPASPRIRSINLQTRYNVR